MRDSARRHLEDLLRDTVHVMEEIADQKTYLATIAASSSNALSPPISGGEPNIPQEQYMALIENDKTLKRLWSFVEPILSALDTLSEEDRRLVEYTYFYGLDSIDRVIAALDMEPSAYYRRKKSILNRMARHVFGVYAEEVQ